MIFTVYTDESGTHASGTTMLAGYVGYAGQWKKFEKKWKHGVLEKFGIDVFHATDVKGWHDDRKEKIAAKVNKLSSSKTLFGFVVDLNDAEFKKHYIGSERLKGVPLDSKYGLCFRMACTLIPQLLLAMFPDERIKIAIVLESGHPNCGDAVRIFDELKGNQEIGPLLVNISFAKKADCYGCQLADALAWSAFGWKRDEAMKLDFYSSEEPQALLKEMAKAMKQSHQKIRVIPNERVLRECRENLLLTREQRKKHWESGGTKPSS